MSRTNQGMTLVEIAVVVAISGVLAAVAVPLLVQWQAHQRFKAVARSLASVLSLAREEAIRTGNNHIVFFQLDAQGNALLDGAGQAVPVLAIEDGRAGAPARNCRPDPGEIVASIQAEPGVAWGVSEAAAAVASDGGAGAMASGSTFTEPDGDPATWVLFRPEGPPAAFDAACALGGVGSGAGAVYLSSGQRDRAVVVSPLGSVRVHSWDGARERWTD